MNIPQLDMHYNELCTFGNIEYTPACCHKHFPRVFNVQCYRIMSGWQGGVRSKEQCLMDEEQNIGDENKKRRIECADTEDGVHSEFQRTHTESMSGF